MAWLARNRLFAWLVRLLTPGAKSWDDVDAYWLPKIDTVTGAEPPYDPRGRRRVFERFFRIGNDPKGMKGLNGTYLFDAIAADPSMAPAVAMYHSALWDLAGATALALEGVLALQSRLIARLGFFQLTAEEEFVAVTTGFLPRDAGPSLRFGGESLRTRACPDALALSCCSYLLALERGNLLQAQAVRDSLHRATTALILSWDAPRLVGTTLRGVLETRCLRTGRDPATLDRWQVFSRRKRKAGPHPSEGGTVRPVRKDLEGSAHWMVPIDADLRAFVKSYRKRHALAHAYVREHRIRIDYGPGPRDDAVVCAEASVRRYYADQLCGPPGAHPAARLAKVVVAV